MTGAWPTGCGSRFVVAHECGNGCEYGYDVANDEVVLSVADDEARTIGLTLLVASDDRMRAREDAAREMGLIDGEP